MNKKKLSIIPILIVLFFILSSCGKSSHVSNLTINTSYDQWIEQINLFSRDNLKVSGYKEENNRIELELEYANGVAGYTELCDVVNAHNRFVEDNPNYFSEDIVTAFIKLNGATVGAIANKEDKFTTDGLKKASDFVITCDSLGIPILTITNSKGFVSTFETEKHTCLHLF